MHPMHVPQKDRRHKPRLRLKTNVPIHSRRMPYFAILQDGFSVPSPSRCRASLHLHRAGAEQRTVRYLLYMSRAPPSMRGRHRSCRARAWYSMLSRQPLHPSFAIPHGWSCWSSSFAGSAVQCPVADWGGRTDQAALSEDPVNAIWLRWLLEQEGQPDCTCYWSRRAGFLFR